MLKVCNQEIFRSFHQTLTLSVEYVLLCLLCPNRRLYREVKLLSRLNHENVVRYYNSWQELCSSRPETGLTEGETGARWSGV